MNNNGYQRRGGPPCPKVERLEELMDLIPNIRKAVENGDDDFGSVLDEITSALDWTHTMLSNRATYQKKNQIKKAAFQRVAKQMLSPDELAAIDEQVNKKLAEEI